MKRFVLGALLLVSSSAMAQDAASQYVQDVMQRVQTILKMSSPAAMAPEFCALAKSNLDNPAIASNWLGDYYQDSTDANGVKEFTNLVPSILITKLMAKLPSNGVQGSFQVDSTSTDNGDGTFSVGVTINTSSNSYNGTAIVATAGSSFVLEDVTYMGFSGVSYLGQDYQQDLENDSSSTPVSDLVHQIRSQAGFVDCR